MLFWKRNKRDRAKMLTRRGLGKILFEEVEKGGALLLLLWAQIGRERRGKNVLQPAEWRTAGGLKEHTLKNHNLLRTATGEGKWSPQSNKKGSATR